MRRLTRHRRDRGAAATWVALLIVPMLVIAALGIDVGMMHVAKQRLQTGADAAALAIATQCSRGICTSTTNALAAQDMATANAPLVGDATASVDVLDTTAGYVEVTTTSTSEHLFGPVAGIDATDLSATAGARWGYPERGTVVMPLAISWCAIAAAVGVQEVRDLSGRIIGVDLPLQGVTTRLTSVGLAAMLTVCPPALISSLGLSPLVGALPFAFLAPGPGCRDTVVEVGTPIPRSPQSQAPAGCSPLDFSQYLGRTVYLPVYIGLERNRVTRTDDLVIYAFVAVTLHGYNLGTNNLGTTVASNPNPCPDTPLQPSNRCLDLTFELELGIDSPPDDFEYGPGAPPIGDPRIELVLPEERP